MSTARVHRSPNRFALMLLAGTPAFAAAQLPSPNVLLTEPRPALLHAGPLDVHGRASASFVYDDNISLHEQDVASFGIGRVRNQPSGGDFIFTFSPGVVVTKPAELKESSRSLFSVEYTLSFIYFVRNAEENSIDHSARLDLSYAFTKLTLGLVQTFQSTAGGVLNRQARRRLMGGYDPYYSYSYEAKYFEKGVYGA